MKVLNMDTPLHAGSMHAKPAPISGCWLLQPKVFADARGHFSETFQLDHFEELTGLRPDFVQDNEVFSHQYVVRGLHFQAAPHAQAKLIRVVQGRIYDVVLDLRKESPAYGTWFGLELSADNPQQLFVPKGFAHGYGVLSETALVQYKVDAPYVPAAEKGVRFDDPALGIDWGIKNPLVSDKDLQLPLLKNLAS